MNDKENAITTADEYEQDSFDLDALEQKLEEEIGDHLSGLEQLKEEHKLIGNPDGIGTVVLNSVWDQFINQVGVVAGEDFIEANRGLTLDLRAEAHIQTTDNFVHGKIASHNAYIDYQNRYDETRQDFQTDPTTETNDYTRYNEDTKVVEKYDPRAKEWKTQFKSNKELRDTWDNRPKAKKDGNDSKRSRNVHIDHIIPIAEQARDMEAAAHIDKEDRITFANSDVNLQDLDAGANCYKSDLPTEKWLEMKDKNGETPDERFPIDKEKMLENDKKAREEYEEMKEKGKQASIET